VRDPCEPVGCVAVGVWCCGCSDVQTLVGNVQVADGYEQVCCGVVVACSVAKRV
jgi:hypothetical protein